MRIPRLGSTLLTLIGAALAVACKREASAASRQGGWSELAHAPGIIVYLDTARIDRSGEGRDKVWLRFVYAQPFAEPNAPAVRYEAAETRQEIDCANQRTRGLELRMKPVGSAAIAKPAPDSVSQSFKTHPLNADVFLVACKTLGHPVAAKASN